MQRFRLLRFYVVGVVAVVAFAVWGVSMRRTAADARTPLSSAETAASSTANTESPSGAGAAQASPTSATTGAAVSGESIHR